MDLNVYQHFRKDEHPFVDSVEEWCANVETMYAPYLSDFLDPRQIYILETIVARFEDLSFAAFGGYESAERKRVMLYPSYYEVKQEDFETDMVEIVYPAKFGQLSHGKILGTLLSTGVKRSFFGDIISDGERWQFFVKKEMASYLELQVKKIGRLTIRLEPRHYTEIILPKDDWSYEQITVSSLRLDNLISSVYNISRQRAKQLIESAKVKVNWTENTRPDFTLAMLDIVSVRGFGRIQLREINGATKKGKIKCELGVLRK